MRQTIDSIDRMMADWLAVRPDLDPIPLGVVGRVLVLARYLEQSVDSALSVHNLTLGQFDILATLRRHEPIGGMNATHLCKSVMLSSGSMTNRLDKLEAAGWLARQSDPNDRRGVVVVLTPEGRKLINAATKTRFAEAAGSLPPLANADMVKLADYLRRWLNEYPKEST